MGSLVRAQEREQKKVTKRLVTFFYLKKTFYECSLHTQFLQTGQILHRTLDKRLLEHNDLNSSYSTKGGQPWEIFLIMHCKSISHAIKLELHIKNMKRKKSILDLKKYPELLERIVQRTIDC